jgi:hypothetical protein
VTAVTERGGGGCEDVVTMSETTTAETIAAETAGNVGTASSSSF